MPKPFNILDDTEWPTAGFHFELPICPESTALGVIDVQGYVIDSDGHLARTVQKHSLELQKSFLERVETMISNIERLLRAFRDKNKRVFFTRHGAQSSDGGDLVVRRRNREEEALVATKDESGHMAIKGEPAYEIHPRVAPRSGELVLDKNTSSAFHTTPVDLYLRNMQIETVVLTGIASDQCVLATAIDAADRGFHVIIASDAVANLDPGCAEVTQILFGRVWGYVMKSDDIIHWITTGETPNDTRIKA